MAANARGEERGPAKGRGVTPARAAAIAALAIVVIVLGIILFGVLVAGVTLNTIFLVREVRRNERLQQALLREVKEETQLRGEVGAHICTFECTFCADCAAKVFGGVCPNCNGNFVSRPIRPAAMLAKYPASTERHLRTQPCVA